MIKTITVPIDGSDYSYKAADYAIEIAAKFNAKIIVVHVLGESSFKSYSAEEDSGEAILSKVTEKAKDKGVETIEHLITGDALRDMKMIIKKTHADLVIMHRFGSNLFTEDLNENQIGSVADRVLKTVDVPILLIK
ncbi:MAG: universal stress protein [archaeon]|nr:universal stress protein [archaeon]